MVCKKPDKLKGAFQPPWIIWVTRVTAHKAWSEIRGKIQVMA
jgi:hypothetical protein